jgi:adenylate cyclase
MPIAPERKLTTILSADVAGYSAMMERDEAATLAQLKAAREMMAREIPAWRGRVVNTAGDGLLAEFASVVNAVECAVRMQRSMAERNANLAEPQRMRFRIGVNLGDVMVDGDDLLGDGVNVAARLQSLAEPGGILISGPVFDQVRTKLALSFDSLGPQSVKNISEPVPAWRVVLNGGGGLGADGGAAHPLPELARRSLGEAGRERVASELARTPGEGDQTLAQKDSTGWPSLKRSATISAVLIVMLFAINMLTESNALWFQWPSLAILAVFAYRAASATEALRGFKGQAVISGVAIAVLLAINLIASPDAIWFQWPTLGILAYLALRAAFRIGR